MRPEPIRKSLQDASFSKGGRQCPATCRPFSPGDAACHRQKAAGIRRLLVFRHNRGASLLQPLGATGASVALRARSAVAVITAVPAAVFTVAVAPLAASEAAFHVGQDGETALLPVVQRLVERVG